MALLSRKADYALLILSHLHQHPAGGNARAIAVKFGLSPPFVANILKELCQKGFVASHRGVKGGYSLARPATSISLAELIETVEDGFRLTMCSPQAHPHGDGGACTLAGREPQRKTRPGHLPAPQRAPLSDGCAGAHWPGPPAPCRP